MEMNMVEVVDSKEALLRLGSKLEKFHETDDGGIGCCPVHDDSTPSLKLTWKDEKVLVHCHAGCAFRKLNAAFKRLGFRVSNLDEEGAYREPPKRHKNTQGRRFFKQNDHPDTLPLSLFDSIKHTRHC